MEIKRLVFTSTAETHWNIKPAAIIKAGLMCLDMLLFPRDFIYAFSLAKPGSCLVVVEADTVFYTLTVKI